MECHWWVLIAHLKNGRFVEILMDKRIMHYFQVPFFFQLKRWEGMCDSCRIMGPGWCLVNIGKDISRVNSMGNEMTSKSSTGWTPEPIRTDFHVTTNREFNFSRIFPPRDGSIKPTSSTLRWSGWKIRFFCLGRIPCSTVGNGVILTYRGFPKMVGNSPTTIGFRTKNDHFGVFWGYPYSHI